MAHAKINLSRMYDWIERNVSLDVPQPTDAEIMEAFSFDSPESARTLLAELADAGRITIKGYGETRTITLGRTKSSLAPAPRPLPAAKKADPVIDAGVAKIAAIVARGGNAGSVRAVQAAAALKAVRTTAAPAPRPSKPPAPHPVAVATVKEPAPMPAKTICLPASAATAISAIEARSRSTSSSLGQAAADLVEAGVVADLCKAPGLALADVSIDELLAEIAHRFAEAAVAAKQSDELAAANARADAAESKLTALREALAA